jgi:lipoyltransferase/lipoate-protein ligase
MMRLIKHQTFSAAMNMALDEVLLDRVAKGLSEPTVRLYSWTPSAISIGFFQSIYDEVHLDVCKKEGVAIVRRQTGGGAVYHDEKGEITYSFIAPESFVKKDILEAYEQICEPLILALKKVGIKATFSPINDIVTEGKKISGNAQKREGGCVLQHGTLLVDPNIKKMFTCLNVSKEKISDKFIQSVFKRVTSVEKESSASYGAVLQALEDTFSSTFNTSIGDYTSDELAAAKKLAETKYSSKEWNYLR